MFDLGWRSSRQPARTPIKKLLAREMSQETESRRRSHNVIARLMGLEGPPPPQPAQRRQRRCFKEPWLTAKVEKAEGSSPFSSRRSSRRSSKEELEFKDVFEVVEAPKVEKSSYQSLGTTRSNITSDEMAFIRQKFMEAKCLSTDDKLQSSKEFHDAIEVLDSNRDLLLKFLQQPDSLFTRHLNDLEGAPFQSRCSRISTAKSSKAHDFHPHFELKSGREKLPRKSRMHSEKLKNNYPGSPYCSPDSLKPSKLERRKDTDIIPTRIVILKPNLGNSYHSTKSPPSPASHSLLSECSSLEEFQSFGPADREQIGREKLSGVMDLKLQSKGPREIAREITMKMKNEFISGSPSIFPLRIRRHGGDSLSTVDINDSANESDITILTSSKSFDWSNQYQHVSCSTESSVNREAKRRLSRRWNTTHKSQEFNSGGTLADMLAISDQGARCQTADALTGRKGFGGNDLSAACDEPLGISSRDGWKEVCFNNLTRSSSVPSSSNFSDSCRENKSCKAPCNCRFTIPREAIKWEKNKKIIGNPDSRDSLASRKLRPREIEHHSCHFIRGESSNASEGIHLRQNQGKISPVGMVPLRRIPISEPPSSIAREDFAVEHEKFPSTETLHLQPSPSSPLLNSSSDIDDQASKEQLNGSSKEIPDPLHHPVPELESHASPKEGDQPSPVSTLETPFTDDLSFGSDCFESLSADLHGLRLQLQMLKLESDAYGEETALISSDEGNGEWRFGSSEDKATLKTEGSWESRYVTDILVHSGFIDYDPKTFVSKLHSLDSPIDPLMFEELEKGLYNEGSSRPERRLLFDRLNSGLNEIYQQLTDPHPWVMAMTPALRYKLSGDGLVDELCRSLVGRDCKANKGTLDKVLMNEMRWLSLGDDFDVIGKEIERLLVDDIVVEVVVDLM